MNELDISSHAELRIRKRLGIKKKAVERFVKEAQEGGTLAKSFKGRFKRYFDKMQIIHKAGNNTFLYRNYMFIVQGEILITVHEVPKMFK